LTAHYSFKLNRGPTPTDTGLDCRADGNARQTARLASQTCASTTGPERHPAALAQWVLEATMPDAPASSTVTWKGGRPLAAAHGLRRGRIVVSIHPSVSCGPRHNCNSSSRRATAVWNCCALQSRLKFEGIDATGLRRDADFPTLGGTLR